MVVDIKKFKEKEKKRLCTTNAIGAARAQVKDKDKEMADCRCVLGSSM